MKESKASFVRKIIDRNPKASNAAVLLTARSIRRDITLDDIHKQRRFGRRAKEIDRLGSVVFKPGSVEITPPKADPEKEVPLALLGLLAQLSTRHSLDDIQACLDVIRKVRGQDE